MPKTYRGARADALAVTKVLAGGLKTIARMNPTASKYDAIAKVRMTLNPPAGIIPQWATAGKMALQYNHPVPAYAGGVTWDGARYSARYRGDGAPDLTAAGSILAPTGGCRIKRAIG